jgi:sugar phosphate isomerase/epimerase
LRFSNHQISKTPSETVRKPKIELFFISYTTTNNNKLNHLKTTPPPMNRRNFLQSSALALAATHLESFDFLKSKKQIALQLWSLRDDMAASPIKTLEKVAAMGYKEVEGFSYADGKMFGMPIMEFKKHLNDCGLKMQSNHMALFAANYDKKTKTLTDSYKKTVEAAHQLGQKYVVCPWGLESDRKTLDGVKHLIETYNAAAELCKSSGLQFAYHNHDFEFKEIEGKTMYDMITQECDSNLVQLEMDVYWVHFAGQKPQDWFDKYPGRFKMLHMKDMAKTEKRETIEVGDGSIDFVQIIKGSKKAGVEKFIVELENYKTTPLQGVELDYKRLKALL